jgi:hypothetical protein
MPRLVGNLEPTVPGAVTAYFPDAFLTYFMSVHHDLHHDSEARKRDERPCDCKTIGS